MTIFTTALTYKSVCKTYSIFSDSDKGKDTVAVFVATTLIIQEQYMILYAQIDYH